MSKKIPTAEEIAEMKVPELRQHAHREKINLEGRDKKADIVESILKHHGLEVPAAGAEGDEPQAQGETDGGDDSTAATAVKLDAALGGGAKPVEPEKPISKDENEELAAKQVKASEEATGLKQAATQLPVPGVAIDAEEGDDQELVGSGSQPAEFLLADGVKVSLGDVVREAHRRTGLSAAKWNQLPDAAREAQISEVVTDLETKGAGIIKKAAGKPKSVKEALEGLLAHEHTVRELMRAHPAAARGWNDAVNEAKRALAN